MHTDLLKSMTLSLFSVCKLSGNPLERKKSVGDRPKRQTVLMVFPSLAMFGSRVWWGFLSVAKSASAFVFSSLLLLLSQVGQKSLA